MVPIKWKPVYKKIIICLKKSTLIVDNFIVDKLNFYKLHVFQVGWHLP